MDANHSETTHGAGEQARLHAIEVGSKSATPEAGALLLSSLDDPSWRVRQAAVEAIRNRGTPEALDAVLLALRDRHEDLALLNSAISVLAQGGIDVSVRLLTYLGDPDPALRCYAILTLGIAGDHGAVPSLIHALDDSDTNVRFHAIEALKTLRAPEAVDALAALAGSGDFFLAFPALDALKAIGEPRIAHRLLPLLADEQLQLPAIETLGAVGDEEVVGPLAALLNGPDRPVEAIAKALAEIHDRYEKSYRKGNFIAELARHSISPLGLNFLAATLEKAELDQAHGLAQVLGWLKGEAVERLLTRMLARPSIREEVLDAIVGRGPEMLELLCRQLQAEDLDTRQAAARALGRIGRPAAVPALIHALQTDERLAGEVAGSLASIGHVSAYGALVQLMAHRETGIRRAAVAALNSLAHPQTSHDMQKYLQDPDPLVRESAVRVAGYAGFPACADLLLERCRDEDNTVRQTAVEHLPYLDDERTAVALREALGDPSSEVRSAAARALGQTADPEAAELLSLALQDNDPWVRYFATRSVARRGEKMLSGEIGKLIQSDPAMQVRIAAVDTLGTIGGKDATLILTSIAIDENADLARAALNALGKLPGNEALPHLVGVAQSTDPRRRIEALRALGETRLPEAIDAIRKAIDDLNPDVAMAAMQALARIGIPQAIQILLPLTANPKRREFCMGLLIPLVAKYAKTIAGALQDPNPAVRRAVVEVLGQGNAQELAMLLQPALTDLDNSVRLAAIAVLAHGSRPERSQAGSQGGK